MNKETREKLYQKLEESYFGENLQEQAEIEALASMLEGVSLFVDAGASLGQYAYYANQKLENSRVVCIEADSFRFAKLNELLAKWERESSNRLEAIHAAVSNEEGEAVFYETNDSLCGGLHQYWDSDELPSYGEIKPIAVNVRCVTLDKLFEDQTPDLIKIDVEGAEYRAVMGARELLKKRKTRFAVEMHPWGDKSIGKTTSDVFKIFHEHNYDFNRFHKLWHFFPSESKKPLWPKYMVAQNVMDSNLLRSWAKKVIRR